MSVFTNTTKVVDRAKPFHRINSPSYDPTRTRASGIGAGCGCRSGTNYRPASVLSAVLRDERVKALRGLPAWVPVEREGKPPENWESLPEVEREIEGILKFSRHASEDVPVGQYHLWYDWNFFVEPVTGYEYIRALGTHDDFGDAIKVGTVECEWDLGAIGDYDFNSPGGRTPTLEVPGPMFGRDWAWPVGGEYIWLAGRWIYDCGHPEDGFTRSELHPCKAVATARWEAVKFDENERHVPAIQFMFFACRSGGYWDFPSISGSDYEFIVDLPDGPAPPVEYPIGHTPEFAMNTIVVRPRLLTKFDYAPFSNARGPSAVAGEADPEIAMLPPENPGEMPKQVKVRIPLTKLPAGRNSYGVIVSLGWHDPAREQAQKVKEVRVWFDKVELTGDLRRFLDTDWKVLGIPIMPLKRLPAWLVPEPGGVGGTIRLDFRVGVNGRWHGLDVDRVNLRMTSLSLKHQGETMFLAEDDDIRITAHGLEEDPSGEMLHRRLDDRTLKGEGGKPFTWRGDFDQRDDVHASRIADHMLSEALWDAFGTISLVTTESDDLGKVVPHLGMFGDPPNPLTVKELMRLPRPFKGRLRARTRIGGPPGTTKPGTTPERDLDFTLHYEIEYRDLLN
jgi:hypothetical protein